MSKTCPKHNEEMYSLSTKHGPMWVCPVKGCDMLCWNGPTSTPADERTRKLRKQVHELFDPHWRTAGFHKSRVRRRAYRWLREAMGLPAEKCHIGMFDLAQCNRAIDALRARDGEL